MKAPLVKSVSETFIGGAARVVVVLEVDIADAAMILDGCDTSQLADAQLEAILAHPKANPEKVAPLPLPEHPAADKTVA